MNIDLNEKEAKGLVHSVRVHLYHTRDLHEKLMQDEKARKLKAGKPQGFCCFSEPDQTAILEKKNKDEEDYLVYLRDKLKKFQMMFPCEEHNCRKYDYGKDFGYEQAKWPD